MNTHQQNWRELNAADDSTERLPLAERVLIGVGLITLTWGLVFLGVWLAVQALDALYLL